MFAIKDDDKQLGLKCGSIIFYSFSLFLELPLAIKYDLSPLLIFSVVFSLQSPHLISTVVI